jgi:lysophospholipase L1-like esterase
VLTKSNRYQWRTSLRVSALGVVAALLLASATTQAASGDRCREGGPQIFNSEWLPRTVATLASHRPFKVVAIGSSSTQGYGASEPRHAYPAQLAALLKLRFPQSAIRVANKGVGGEETAGMVARFERDVFAERPDLVIWQTGTNDALQHIPVDRFAENLRRGIAELKAHGVDIILMTPQYAPEFNDVGSHARYLAVMRSAAAEAHVPVFERFAMSKAWFFDRRFAEAPVLTADGLHQSDVGYHCDALMLTDSLAAAVALPSKAAALQ